VRPAILVTGGARRVGRAIALHLAQAGYDIALHYNHSDEEAQQTAADIKNIGAACQLFQADLADISVYDDLIMRALKAFPSLVALVNNASVFDRGTFMESDVALYQKEFRINFEAPVFLTQVFARHVKEGAVVNMLDTNVTRQVTSYFFYSLSKKALLEFTRMAARELGAAIRVNAVCPGYLLPSEGWGEEYRAKLEQNLPLKKIASVEDVAQAVHILITTPSLTGQVLFIDGGESLI
jgi:NAD(P)-dependent dehydrogenase (short-subunit alcohol dehydrogenase family)